MNFKKSKILLLSIIAISASLTLVSCNKKNVDVIAKDQIATEKPVTVAKTETITKNLTETKVTSESKIQTEEVKPTAKLNQLNIEDFGFELKDDFLYYKNTLISANKFVNYSIDAETAKFNNSDGTSLTISKDGSIEAKFPVGITLNVGPNLTNFVFSYKDVTVKLPTIQNFAANNDWYSIALTDNANIRFNDTSVIITTDKISFIFNEKNVITKYENIIISNSNIEALDIELPKINISYVDGSKLQHTVGFGTTFILQNGSSIFNDINKTTFTTKGITKILVGELTLISQDTENNSITFSTSSDSYTLYLVDIEAVKTLNTATNEATGTSLIEPVSKAVEVDSATANIKDQELVAPLSSTPVDNVIVENKKQTIDVSLSNSTENFDNSLIIDNKISKPFIFGVMANYTFFYGKLEELSADNFTNFGLRLDFVIEKEFLPNWDMGLELGIGTDKFNVGYINQFVPMFTITHDFDLLNNNTLSPYLKVGVGSLIFINGDSLSPFFRAKVGGGVKFNFTESLTINVGADYNFLYKAKVVSHAFDAQVGLTYKY